VLGGAGAAYAAARPPGHHVGPAFYGGSCHLNNAAVAAQYLVDRGGARVAVIDIDAHHGNGTQEVFWDRGDVWFGSVHVDPGAGWFPHTAGFADETGTGEGADANRNLPLAPGTGDGPWNAAVDDLVTDAVAHGAEALVVSLGVDAAAGDPESPLEVTGSGFAAAGRSLAAPGLPTLFVQEGGYDLDTLGDLVLAVLGGFEEARR
jgi:acetoin utilization deacetylase AcuC-like enzyme